MNALLVLYSGNLSSYAREPLSNGKNALQLCVERGTSFPGVNKTVLLTPSDGDFSGLNGIQVEQSDSWTKRSVLQRISELQEGFNCIYFAYADCPFLDPSLAGVIAERHIRYAAEYSYADGWPYGLAPEILSPGTAGILVKILGEDGPVERDMLFSVIQKDINAFDIETEISSVDLRCHRLNFCADSKRNLLLLNNFLKASGGKIPSASDAENIIENNSEILKTLPSFFPIQVYGGCPQKCAICPYPLFTDALGRNDYMEKRKFESILDKIVLFSNDAVIDLSMWGELSLHPQKLELIEAVLSRNTLSLVIETSGIGWKTEELEKCAGLCAQYAQNRNTPFPSLSWIVSLDTIDQTRYATIRGAGYAEASACVNKLFSIFPKDCYVQAVRIKGGEDDTEKFYRHFKDASPCGEKNIIIQKYDDFCGSMEKKQASDISPVIRKSCWHIMRDLPILINGSVPLCREDMTVFNDGKDRILGNIFSDSLETIWQNGQNYYREHCNKSYPGICANCDEYYTFNF
ncbi:MAG: spiro-SPASM protein [Treponema sp.]|nr:spiro-SPASM protein [Treponema sp.]